jgi:hypothetical protein
LIIFFENGRLGNQLFQYAGLRIFFSDQKIVTFGCDNLVNLLSSCSVVRIPLGTEKKINIFGFAKSTFNFLVKIRLLGLIQEQKNQNKFWIKKRNGLIPIFLLETSFFQHQVVSDYLSLYPYEFRIKSKYIEKAKIWLCANEIDINSNELVFVHIRRGDYISWPSSESSAIIGLDWYIKKIEFIRKKIKKPKFIILSDDIYFIKPFFDNLSDTLISENNLYLDMALMSLCDHGILSPSSFAWWGSWFSLQRNRDKHKIFLAPLYWGGHKIKKWEPEGFITNWINYVK